MCPGGKVSCYLLKSSAWPGSDKLPALSRANRSCRFESRFGPISKSHLHILPGVELGRDPESGEKSRTWRCHYGSGRPANTRPSPTRPHDFRETERESGGSASKWADAGSGETTSRRPARVRPKAQVRLRAGRDGCLRDLWAHSGLCGAETFDYV